MIEIRPMKQSSSKVNLEGETDDMPKKDIFCNGKYVGWMTPLTIRIVTNAFGVTFSANDLRDIAMKQSLLREEMEEQKGINDV